MSDYALWNISPVDGRYHSATAPLKDYFSEYALIRYRIRVEVEYFIALSASGIPYLSDITVEQKERIRDIYRNFSTQDGEDIKGLEKTTNHDVKAVEYFLREKFKSLSLEKYIEYIHFGLTSQDINNTSIPLLLKESNENEVYPSLQNLFTKIESLAGEWKDIPMLARTHGQPASPTRMGKEWKVFHERLQNQFRLLMEVPYSGKFGGATGNFNAHHVAFPNIRWVDFANDFLHNELGIERSQTTTQIEHYDNMAAWFDGMKRINTILVDLCRDIWTYISMDYFKQKISENEVGSSAMPHKVNPIDFENAEGNLAYANAIFEFLSAKLPISRLQRDLTDSTVLRNIGVPVAHTFIAIRSIHKGLDKLLIHEEKIRADLQEHCVVIAEAIQTVLRRENYPHPYDALKKLTRAHEKITMERLREFIMDLEVRPEVKEELLAITPENYTGIA